MRKLLRTMTALAVAATASLADAAPRVMLGHAPPPRKPKKEVRVEKVEAAKDAQPGGARQNKIPPVKQTPAQQ